MNQFIKLSSRIINKSHIIEIVKTPNVYEIYLTNSSISGEIILSSGNVYTKQNIITIHEKYDKQDYETINKFITEIK